MEIGKYKTSYETLAEVKELKRQVNIISNSNEDLKQINKELVIELTEKNKNISDGSNGANLKSVKGCKSKEDMIRQEVERYFMQRRRRRKKKQKCWVQTKVLKNKRLEGKTKEYVSDIA